MSPDRGAGRGAAASMTSDFRLRNDYTRRDYDDDDHDYDYDAMIEESETRWSLIIELRAGPIGGYVRRQYLILPPRSESNDSILRFRTTKCGFLFAF